jgi:hypothetical protein
LKERIREERVVQRSCGRLLAAHMTWPNYCRAVASHCNRLMFDPLPIFTKQSARAQGTLHDIA